MRAVEGRGLQRLLPTPGRVGPYLIAVWLRASTRIPHYFFRLILGPLGVLRPRSPIRFNNPSQTTHTSASQKKPFTAMFNMRNLGDCPSQSFHLADNEAVNAAPCRLIGGILLARMNDFKRVNYIGV